MKFSRYNRRMIPINRRLRTETCSRRFSHLAENRYDMSHKMSNHINLVDNIKNIVDLFIKSIVITERNHRSE
ncbi:hypothetical protein AR158_C611R [Paramecium bursaria Chlorella virus AR158]|uniref:hypothetical protein n=1 Tax=Paramecium bursaria Chlorella virus AR158 TaxID=380598 RepID=UPI00015AA7CC|nr:hypothetical protein AR158_C611R [Paramecium bursaria Chlorella virus AR158]ABU44156.1 hypothetical protein AR158_C611R [Paramecium bursaria Chlorella virus AR158]